MLPILAGTCVSAARRAPSRSRCRRGGYYSRKGEWTESLEYYRKAYTHNWVDHMRLIIYMDERSDSAT